MSGYQGRKKQSYPILLLKPHNLPMSIPENNNFISMEHQAAAQQHQENVASPPPPSSLHISAAQSTSASPPQSSSTMGAEGSNAAASTSSTAAVVITAQKSSVGAAEEAVIAASEHCCNHSSEIVHVSPHLNINNNLLGKKHTKNKIFLLWVIKTRSCLKAKLCLHQGKMVLCLNLFRKPKLSKT